MPLFSSMIENRLRTEYPSEELSEKGDVKTTSLSLSPSLTGEIVLDLLAVLPKPWIFCMDDMFLCHYINVTKIICELDPRVKKLLYLCSCPYVSMLKHSLYLCPYVSMLVPLCFYDRNFFYAHVLMFLCP